MSDLRKKMMRDLCIKGYSEITCKDYIRNVANFAKYFNKSPDIITLEEIYQYQEFLTKTRKISFSYFNQIVCSIKFLYKITLKKNLDIKLIPYQKKRRKLPVVLAKEEIIALFEIIESLRDKLMLYAIYSAGLRISELVNLKPSDIDSKRMVIRIDQGKGRKDRYVFLSKVLLEGLREYWLQANPKPQPYLFPGKIKGKSLTKKAVNRFLKIYAKKAGITKSVTPHTLRHTFATHMLEDGVNIRIIQFLLGHKSLRTTAIYTHIASNFLATTSSPLDTLIALSNKEDTHEE